MRSYSFLAALAALPSTIAGPAAHHPACHSLSSQDITSAGNNSLFTRWRPQYHFIAPAGWMNDPCGPVYDPVRDVYQIFYQWHPQHFNWGNISWGQAYSKDLVTWTDRNSWRDADARALGPAGNGTYNGLGIFSGTAQPVNLKGQADGTLLLFYTSVAHLPTSWSIPYQPYTETQSIAMSHDGGKTWTEYENNPVINATTETAPMHWNLTGFRDPYVEPWPEMDAILEVDEPHYYAVFGSGIKGVGPRMPFWTAPASDLTKWTFLGALWEPAKNTSLGPMLSTGNYAFNFEVSGFFALYDRKGQPHHYINMGTEGGNVSFHSSPQWALWNEGKVSRRSNGSAEFAPIAGGAGDWGVSYALTSFNDTKHNRRVQVAWAKEDIVGMGGIFSAKQQGFSGSHTLLRELFVHEVDNVVDPDGSLAESKNAVLISSNNSSKTFTAQTLGVKPLPDVVSALRKGACHKHHITKPENLTTSRMFTTKKGRTSQNMNLRGTFHPSRTPAGFIIYASPDQKEYTTISYHANNHTILIDRTHSSLIPEFNNETMTGYFHPYTLSSSPSQPEQLTMDIYMDGSLVEIYINERFAMTARIYTAMTCSTGFGAYVAEGGKGVTFEKVESWVGLRNVWPERPANSSSPLLWDSAAETDDYTWWTGN